MGRGDREIVRAGERADGAFAADPRPAGAKVVLPRGLGLTTMGIVSWPDGIGAPSGAGVVFSALATATSLDLLLRRGLAARMRPARARAKDRGRRGGARP